MPLKTYDEPLGLLQRVLDAARLGDTEEIEGFRRQDRLTRTVEANRHPLSDFTAAVTHEREISASLDGRTVFDDERPRKERSADPQLSLFPY